MRIKVFDVEEAQELVLASRLKDWYIVVQEFLSGTAIYLCR